MMELVDEHLIVVVRRTTIPDASARGTARVALLRATALAALAQAAQSSGAQLGKLEKDERDAPIASNGWHWTISHTSLGDAGLVAAAVSRNPVGIDAEALGTPRPEVVDQALSAAERRLFRDSGEAIAFTRTWTAKEAVLKKLGLGLMSLSELRLEDVDGDLCVLERDGVRHAVESRSFLPFIVAVAGRAREGVDWRSSEPGAREVAL